MSDTNALLHLWTKRRTEPLPVVHYPLLFHMLDVAIDARELLNMSLHHGTRHFFSRQLGLQEAEASATS